MKFGRPPKLTDTRKQEIYSRRMAGATIGQLAKEFNLGEASIYRAINAVKQSGSKPELKTMKVILWLQVENNSKFVRGKGKSRQHIEDYCLSEYSAKKLEKDGWEYELTFQYTDDEDLEKQIYDLAAEMSREADLRNGFVECSFTEVGTDRSW
ncbi:MAG: helix-turn-helix domain-containing protein [Candidatus Thiodiazotropha lotti]|nr:helix-turn-helix domain-containing protein [Candidatus Thiodiazotropha lotti]MCG8005950.1 helix-turn-helix domain-containing protein [Candidatus Thiodiazotropha lotti]MCG8007283.1 helix-turn-helix domain-containing protein [Candidatus Thiodiazotropha lotti]MCW4189579.1 helix-turn-helix domain-containing protein [Candidatus Thiodiazotropha lotti]MCW4194865.1 helix-turn-helix domain-containing protein [Candidatus Thiodiazotropha lotti]